jgi:hypothetical protein
MFESLIDFFKNLPGYAWHGLNTVPGAIVTIAVLSAVAFTAIVLAGSRRENARRRAEIIAERDAQTDAKIRALIAKRAAEPSPEDRCRQLLAKLQPLDTRERVTRVVMSPYAWEFMRATMPPAPPGPFWPDPQDRIFGMPVIVDGELTPGDWEALDVFGRIVTSGSVR